ncbi:uncharacterized protein LOC110829795 [Zootermopsis nevadensis]|nr:uncharacterized protein LOC110829795 [Zootermopsis nevadensis]
MADDSINNCIDVDVGAWNKMCTTLANAGFRDGAAAGRDAVFQKGFDTGYAEGYQAALSLGYLKGALSTIIHHTEMATDSAVSVLNTSLEKTSVGMCQLCQTNPTKIQDHKGIVVTKSMSDIIGNQRDYIRNALDKIEKDNSHLLNEWSATPKESTGRIN